MEWGKLSVWLLWRRFIWFGHSGDACLVWLLGRCFIWFSYSGDALSGLVTQEMLGLVWLLGRCFIWFGYSGDALSGLDTRETLGLIWHPRVVSEVAWWQFSKHCLVSITRETLSDLTHSGDAVSRWHHSGDVIRPWPGYPSISVTYFLSLVSSTLQIANISCPVHTVRPWWNKFENSRIKYIGSPSAIKQIQLVSKISQGR